MNRLLSLLVALLALTICTAGKAQEVLDRVDPTRLEQRKVDELAGEQPAEVATSADTTSSVAERAQYTIGAIQIVGLQKLRNSDFSDIIQQYMGQSLSGVEIAALADRLAARARDSYPLASVRIAPQALEKNILQVDIDEGRVDAVELQGFSNRRVAQILNALADGDPVTSAQLERAVLLARDIDGVRIAETTIRRDGDRNVLVVKGFYTRFRGQVSVDNDSTKPIGPFEIFGFVQSNGVLSHDDALQLYFLSALPQPDELAFLRLRYAKRIDRNGTEISIAGSYSFSNPGSYLAPLEIDGDGAWVGIALSRPLERSVASSLWLEANLSYRELRQDSRGVRSRLDRLTVARARLFGNGKFAGGIIRSSMTLSRGLDVLGATGFGDPLSSREDSDGTFTSLQLEGQWATSIAGPLGLLVGVRSQLATDPLLVSEEIGLGGSRFARGYDYSERSGDQGTQGYIELAYEIEKKVGPFNGLTPYAFFDGGTVTNLANGRGGGSLFSTGAGVRLDVDRRTDASIEFAAPLSGPRYDTDTRAVRIRASLTRYF